MAQFTIEEQRINRRRCQNSAGPAGWLLRVVELTIACSLLFTGLVHIGNSYFFLSSILGYRIVPVFVAKQLALALPLLHVLVALLIVAGSWRLSALWIATGLFFVYGTAQITVLARGLQIDCGCFGIDSGQVGIASILKVFTLCASSLVVSTYRYRAAETNQRAASHIVRSER